MYLSLESIYNLLRFKGRYTANILTNQARRYITVREALTSYEKKYIYMSGRNVYDTILYSQYDLTYKKKIYMYMYVGGILCNTFELVWMPRLLTRKRKEGKEDDDREGSAAARV